MGCIFIWSCVARVAYREIARAFAIHINFYRSSGHSQVGEKGI
uniref:Uncharacterized protein n=1 Tax=Rhizophora mucronata TaxID=61149 RepID=A0A2P2QDL5_RHIMU